MLTFKYFLVETYKNVFTKSDKEKWVDQVFDVLQSSYKSIGGLKTPSLATKEKLIDGNHMWKMSVKDGVVKTVKIYKQDDGRKSIATGTDGTKEGKEELRKSLKDEFSRSYSEVSDAMEAFIFKSYPDLANKYKIKNTDAQHLLKPKEFRILKDDDGYHYERLIAGHWHTKIMLGTPKLKNYDKWK